MVVPMEAEVVVTTKAMRCNAVTMPLVAPMVRTAGSVVAKLPMVAIECCQRRPGVSLRPMNGAGFIATIAQCGSYPTGSIGHLSGAINTGLGLRITRHEHRSRLRAAVIQRRSRR